MSAATTARGKKATTFTVDAAAIEAAELETSERMAAIRKGKSRAKNAEKTSDPLPVGPGQTEKLTNTIEIVPVALRLLVDSPFQTRGEPSEESIAELAASLARDGQRDPIRIRALGNKWELIGGHRRTRAARRLGWTMINATVLESSDAEAAFLVWDDNKQHSQLNAIERAKGLKLIWDQYQAAGRSMDQMAIDCGIDQSTISNRLRILVAPESLQQRLIDGDVSEHRLRGLATWAKFDGVLERFEKELSNRSSSGPVSNDHWFASLRIAIESKSKPAKKRYSSFGSKDDPLFPVEKHRDELDIVTVKLEADRPGEERCFNTSHWWELQREAVKKRDAAAKAKAEKESQKKPDASETRRTDRDHWVFRTRLKNAWIACAWSELYDVLFKGNLTKPQRHGLVRLLPMVETPSEEWLVKTLKMSADEFVDCCVEYLSQEWSDSPEFNYSWETVSTVCSMYGVDASSTWKPSKDLLESCEIADLREMSDELTDAGALAVAPAMLSRGELVTLLLDNWTPGFVPELFILTAKKPKRGK